MPSEFRRNSRGYKLLALSLAKQRIPLQPKDKNVSKPRLPKQTRKGKKKFTKEWLKKHYLIPDNNTSISSFSTATLEPPSASQEQSHHREFNKPEPIESSEPCGKDHEPEIKPPFLPGTDFRFCWFFFG